MRLEVLRQVARNIFLRDCSKTLKTFAKNSSSQPSIIFSRSRLMSSNGGTNANQTKTSTIDAEEVERFSRLANEWWDESGEFGPLHSMNDLRIPLIRDGLLAGSPTRSPTHPLNGLKILDVGCGGGILCEPLARLGAEVTGVDASEENIETAKLHATYCPSLAERLSYRCTTVEELSAREPGSFDGVVASEVIEHVNNQPQFVKSCCELVKPGGSLFFTTINRTQMSYWLAIVAAERIFRIVPEGIHDWQKFISPEEIEHHMKNENFRTVFVRGMTMNPLNFRFCWTENTLVNYAMHAVKALPPLTEERNSE